MIFRKPSTDVEGFRLENLMNEALQRRELLYYLASGGEGCRHGTLRLFFI